MILPTHEECARVLDLLAHESHLTDWEVEFVESNHDHKTFTDPQREVIAKLIRKYDVDRHDKK